MFHPSVALLESVNNDKKYNMTIKRRTTQRAESTKMDNDIRELFFISSSFQVIQLKNWKIFTGASQDRSKDPCSNHVSSHTTVPFPDHMSMGADRDYPAAHY